MPFLSRPRWFLAFLLLASSVVPCALTAQAPSIDPRLYAGLTWRNVGPFRGGRVAGVTGVIGQPGTFYAAFPGGGVWKTTSAGTTWFPVFDAVKSVSSVGAVEVAPSDANIVYVGTGDMISGGTLDQGDGVYRSSDAGRTWQHLGLDASRHIQTILVDPRNPDIVMVGALGDHVNRSDVRGVFRSTDGGRTWSKPLYISDDIGIAKLARAYDVPDVIFATTVRHFAPRTATPDKYRSWQLGVGPDTGRAGTTVWKSTDNGVTWHEVKGAGLPRLDGRTSIAVAMRTNAQRLYLITNTALYRSDDGGANWRQMAADDDRIRNGQGGYSCGVYVDPQNPDLVYTINTAAYRSTDGGATFTGLKGAPGGDDPQQLWIDPTNGQRILMGLDQGATVSLDGGATWSSWLNQSTEQLYHVASDNSFPYYVYAAQQDAGAIRTRSRGNYGAVTMHDWNGVNGWEWGTVLPDPRNPNIVYASGSGLVKITYPSEQWINVSPAVDPALPMRVTPSQPLLFTPWNTRQLLAGTNYVLSTLDGGAHWKRISPDLGIPASLDSATAAKTVGGRGAIESMSASTVAAGTIWVGTNNGLVHLTRDGGRTWRDVSVPGLPNVRRANVSMIEASHHDAGTAYVAIEYLRSGDHAPYLYRTRDFGATWTRIVTGLATDEPSGSFVRAIRADVVRKGLLFAGTESAMYVSFDDGDHWQSLQQNLPNTPFRDIEVRGADLIVATHGRGIWILDDMAMLRQLSAEVAATPAHLFAPGVAVRMHRNVSWNTPLPPEIPHAVNPPDGVSIDYWLGAAPSAPVTIEIRDASGATIRHLSSAAPAAIPEARRPPFPDYWIGTPYSLPAAAGGNRAVWDLREDAPPTFSRGYEINANYRATPATPEGPLVPPGIYTVTLRANGRTLMQRVTVRNDPRSPATTADLLAQSALQRELVRGMAATWSAAQKAAERRRDVAATAGADQAAQLARIDSLTGAVSVRGALSLQGLNGSLMSLLMAQDNADMAPTAATRAAVAAGCRDVAAVMARSMDMMEKASSSARTSEAGTAARAPRPRGCGAAGRR